MLRNWDKRFQRLSVFAERHSKITLLAKVLLLVPLIAVLFFGMVLRLPLLIGLGCFLVGFYQLRKAKVLADVPQIPIRSAALGIVTIRGKVEPDQMVPAPVSGRPCCFFKVEIQEWDKDHHQWTSGITDYDGPRFFLADETGKVLIDAHYPDRLEFDPPQTVVRVVDSSISAGTTDAGAPTDDELLRYISRGIVPMRRRQMAAAGEDVGTWTAPATGRYQLTEFLVFPGQEYQVTGTCTENPNSRNEDDRIVICQGEHEAIFVISSKTGSDLAMDKLAIGWGMIILASIWSLVWLICFHLAGR